MSAASLSKVSLLVLVAAIGIALVSSPAALGQGKKGRDAGFANGDRVEVRQGNTWQAAEVVETTRGGLVKVRIAGKTPNRVVAIPTRLVRRPGAEATTPAASSPTPRGPAARAPAASKSSADMRVWTDTTGKHKVEAEFVEVAEGKVTLRKRDGSRVVLALERLCQEDQDLIASLTENGDDLSPEDVLRQFLVALASGNRKQTIGLMAPHPSAALLFQGKAAPPQVVAQMSQQLASEEIRRLRPGETVSLPGGGTMEVSTGDVNADRVLLQIPNHPVPYAVVRKRNGWRVDATPLIDARKAAEAMHDDVGAQKPVTTHERNAAIQVQGWQTIKVLEDRVSIQMPGKAPKVDQVSQSTLGPVTFVLYKYAARGRFWNFQVITYPAEVIEAATDKTEFLRRIGAGMMRGKTGSEQLLLETVSESSFPAIRLKYRYPAGRNSAGEYGGGQASHELYLIGNQVIWAFVDVLDVAREVENDKVEAQIQAFFASLVLPPP